jgi:hypothetical protein
VTNPDIPGPGLQHVSTPRGSQPARSGLTTNPGHNRDRHEPILADSPWLQTQVSDGHRQPGRILQTAGSQRIATGWEYEQVADTRTCEQCGSLFVPRREHARFCSTRCRAAWNREHTGDLKAGASALQWAITAMSDTTERLPRVRAADLQRALAVIGDAVWWVTIVDATLVRHHPAAYDAVMAGQRPARRELTEGTLAGLRFVRNQIGHRADLAEFTGPCQPGTAVPHAGAGRITAWAWKPVPEPELVSLPPRGQAWEMTRYRAYQVHLAGHTAGESFGRAAEFLKLAAAGAASITGGQERLAGQYWR